MTLGLGAAPVGVSKKLPLGHPKPGAPSHADFSVFKGRINPGIDKPSRIVLEHEISPTITVGIFYAQFGEIV